MSESSPQPPAVASGIGGGADCPECGHADKATANRVDRLVNRLWRLSPSCGHQIWWPEAAQTADCPCRDPWHVTGT